MRSEMKTTLLFLAASLLASAAGAGPVERVACPEGIYHIAPFHMTIDYGAKTVMLKEAAALEPVDDPVIKDLSVEWGFMRGSAVYHRDSHLLEWDATAEYDYLDGIGHAPSEPRDSYSGKAQCVVEK